MKVTHHLNIERSRQVVVLIALASCAAALGLLTSGLPHFQLASLLSLLICLTAYSVWKDGFRPLKHRVVAIHWVEEQKSGDSWVLELSGGRQVPVALSESASTLNGRLITLVFLWRDSDAYVARYRLPRRLSVLLLADSGPQEQLRQLRLTLNALR